jgi:hypothetical protein
LDVVALFIFRQLSQFVRGIPQHAVQNAAAIVFTIRIALIGQRYHLLNQRQRSFDVKVARSQRIFLRLPIAKGDICRSDTTCEKQIAVLQILCQLEKIRRLKKYP